MARDRFVAEWAEYNEASTLFYTAPEKVGWGRVVTAIKRLRACDPTYFERLIVYLDANSPMGRRFGRAYAAARNTYPSLPPLVWRTGRKPQPFVPAKAAEEASVS